MLKLNVARFILLLILVVILLLGCSTTANYDNCPHFPIGGKKVADELESVPYQGNEDFWEWIARLYKLKQELDICKTPTAP